MHLANLRRFWLFHLLHFAVGFFAGILLTSKKLPAAGATLMAMVLGRQGLEYAKRKDTPGIDLFYTNTGLVLGIFAGVILIEKLVGELHRHVRENGEVYHHAHPKELNHGGR